MTNSKRKGVGVCFVLGAGFSLFSPAAEPFGERGYQSLQIEKLSTRGVKTTNYPDGRTLLVAVGARNGSIKLSIGVSRFLADGTLDLAFGDKGTTTFYTQSFPGFDVAAVAILKSGKILVAGSEFVGEDTDLVFARINENGGMDSTFGKDGVITTDVDFGTFDLLTGFYPYADGSWLAFSLVYYDDKFSSALLRYLPTGELDPNFGNGGRIIYPGDETTRMLPGTIGIAKDKKIYAIMNDISSSASYYVVYRFFENGMVDTAYGERGKLTIRLATGAGKKTERMLGNFVQPDGRFVAAGIAETKNGDNVAPQNIFLLRFDEQGKPDLTLGPQGRVDIAYKPQTVGMPVFAFDPSNRIHLGFTKYEKEFLRFEILRLLPTGKLDASFGQAGKTEPDLGKMSLSLASLGFDFQGRILFSAGTLANGSDGVAVVGRLLPHGPLDSKK